MRLHTLPLVLSFSFLSSAALAAPDRDDRPRKPAVNAEITHVELASASEAGVEYEVAGTLAANTSAQLGILYSSDRARWIEVGATVRGNSKGEFFGGVGTHSGPKALAVVLLDRGTILDMQPIADLMVTPPGIFWMKVRGGFDVLRAAGHDASRPGHGGRSLREAREARRTGR